MDKNYGLKFLKTEKYKELLKVLKFKKNEFFVQEIEYFIVSKEKLRNGNFMCIFLSFFKKGNGFICWIKE